MMVGQATIRLKLLAAVSAFAGSEEARYYLCGVRVEITEKSVLYVATDNHRLLAWRDSLGTKAKNDLIGAYIIPARACRHFAERGEGVLSKNADRLELKCGDEAISFTPLAYNGPRKNADWVDWRRVIPKEQPTRELAHFNGDYIGAFAKFAHEIGGSAHFPVVFPNGPKTPAIVRFPWHDDAIGVLMPMEWRKAFDEMPLPEWVTA